MLPLAQTMIGLVFIVNSFVVNWVLSESNNPIAAGSAMIGAIILGYPIVWTAIQDLRRGLLTTNELVALAVLASFGSADYQAGGYQQAGIIAFFMLMGQIIETRTAEGARASIESLIKLTPPKARRITKAGEEEVETRASGRRRRDSRPTWRQRRRRRRDSQRPGVVQSGHNHRRIVAGG